MAEKTLDSRHEERYVLVASPPGTRFEQEEEPMRPCGSPPKPGPPVRRATPLVAVSFLVGAAWGSPWATEPAGALDLEVRLVEVARGADAGPDTPAGHARLAVVVRSLAPIEGLSLEILHPDGTPWAMDPPMAGRTLAWEKRPTEPPVELPNGSVSLGPKDRAVTRLDVPLEGTAIHEIIVRASGLLGGQPIATEAMVEAPLGVDYPGRLENDAIEFDAVGGGQP
jgi:hypothetical protein